MLPKNERSKIINIRQILTGELTLPEPPPRCVQSSCQIAPGHEGHSGHQVLEVEGGLIELVTRKMFPRIFGHVCFDSFGIGSLKKQTRHLRHL